MESSCRHRRFYLTLLLWVMVASGWAQLLRADSEIMGFVGKSRAYVLQQWGPPPSTANSEDHEILTYPKGRIFLSNGIVTEVGAPLSKTSTSSPGFSSPKNDAVKVRTPTVPVVYQLAPPRQYTVIPTAKPGLQVSTGARPVARPEPAASAVMPSPSRSRPAPSPYDEPPSFFNQVIGPLMRATGWLLLIVVPLGILKNYIQKPLIRRRASTESSGVFPRAAANAEPASGVFPSRPTAPVRTRLDAGLLDELDWLLFEKLTAEYFRAEGFRADLTKMGADGGVDIYLHRDDNPRPFACVQCKAWGSQQIGVKTVRELFGVMVAAGINEGYCVGIGEFSADARAFAEGNNLHLISGELLIARFNRLPEPERVRILGHITQGDYTTPSCAKCGTKLVKKELGGRMQWCCPLFPKCRPKPIAVRQR